MAPTAEEMQRKMQEMERQLQEAQERADREGERADRERERANQQAERANQQAERASQQAERANQQAERANQQAERANNVEKEIENTDLPTYLDAVHSCMYQKINVNEDPYTTTQGSMTDPKRKLCPTRIREWKDFETLQKNEWESLSSTDTEFFNQKQFSSLHSLQDAGNNLPAAGVSSEKDLEFVVRLVIENPVTSILGKIGENSVMARKWELAGTLAFQNHANGVDNGDEEVATRLQTLEVADTSEATKPPPAQGFTRGLDASREPRQGLTKPDQICILTTPEGRRMSALVIEYKPPHKLSTSIIDQGLHEMDPFEDIVNRVDKLDAVGHAELLVAAAITQTFDYMVESGLQYGYLCTGKAFIFLHFQQQDPETLLYYLSMPGTELSEGTGWETDSSAPNLLHTTALARVTVFCLQAINGTRLDQQGIQSTKQMLQRWEPDYGAQLSKIPETVRKPRPSSPYKPSRALKKSNVAFSPRCLRSRNQCAPPPDPNPKGPRHDSESEEDDDNNGDNHDMGSPSPLERKTRTNRAGPGRYQTGKERSYCTQKCLLGLSQLSTLDRQCPNIHEHQKIDSDRHTISRQTFLRLMRAQLAADLDTDVHCWGICGSRGVMFKVTLSSHGYTVVGKGTVFAWVTDLRHEELVYRHLQNIQGKYVPVCLGNADLEVPYSYTPRAQLIHMMFLAYAGQSPKTPELAVSKAELSEQAAISMEAIHRRGVAHKDVALRNMLWNEELQRVMFVDFERSVVFGPTTEKKKQPLGTISLNPKRKRGPQEQEKLYTKDQGIVNASKYTVVLKNKFDNTFDDGARCAALFDWEALEAKEIVKRIET